MSEIKNFLNKPAISEMHDVNILGGMKKSVYLLLLLFIVGCKHSSDSKLTAFATRISPDLGQPKRVAPHLKHYLKYDADTIAFTNVTIIDGTGGAIKYNQTLLVEGDSLSAIGQGDEIIIPENATIIDANRNTIIPGFIGMHNHLHIPQFPDITEVAVKLYLASGVTTIQTCGAASPYVELDFALNIARGNKIGPDIVPSAPFIDGEGGNPNMIIPRNETHLRDTMQHWLKQGVKWFKVYRNITPENLQIVIDEAHKNGAKVKGHLCSVTFEEATKLGIDGIEHGLNSTSDFRTNKGYGVCGGDLEYMDTITVASPKVRNLLRLMNANNVVLTSTLSIFEASIPNRGYADHRSLKVMSPYLINQYTERRKAFEEQLKDHTRNDRLERIMQFAYQYYKLGGLLCSGVDAGRHIVPGFGDQRNYELLIEAGFLPEEAIQVMTGNGALALELPDIGTIQEGKRADFIVLNGNLPEDASVIKKVDAVFKKGVGYDPQKILKDTVGKLGLE